MSVIWDFDIEAGNLNAFGGQIGSDISASQSAALAGTSWGCAVLIDDVNDNYLYHVLGSPNTTGKWRVRFYLDPNSLTMADLDNFKMFGLRYSTGDLFLCTVQLLRASGGYYIYCGLYNDSNARTDSSNYAITDAPHYIEFYLQRASTNVASDGSMQLWIDGVSKQTISGIDNYDQCANLNAFRLGAFSSKYATTSGTFYLDELVVNDDGSEIGPLSAESSSVSPSVSPSYSASPSASQSPSSSVSSSVSRSVSKSSSVSPSISPSRSVSRSVSPSSSISPSISPSFSVSPSRSISPSISSSFSISSSVSPSISPSVSASISQSKSVSPSVSSSVSRSTSSSISRSTSASISPSSSASASPSPSLAFKVDDVILEWYSSSVSSSVSPSISPSVSPSASISPSVSSSISPSVSSSISPSRSVSPSVSSSISPSVSPSYSLSSSASVSKSASSSQSLSVSVSQSPSLSPSFSASSSPSPSTQPPGPYAFGEQNPTQGESPIEWQTWSDGSGGIPTITGDANWGKLHLEIAEEGRSEVYDLGDAHARIFTMTENLYGSGSGSAILQIRGDTVVFSQDDGSPAWESYTSPISGYS